MKDFHRDFYGAGFGEIAVVGDFDAEAFKAQAEKHFGSWTTKQPFVRLPDPAVDVAAADESFETPDKANAVIMLRTDLPMKDTDPDYVALSAASYVLGGGTRSYDARLDLRVVYQFICRNHPLPDEPQYPLWQGLSASSTLTRAELARGYLLQGNLTLVECFYRSNPFNSWMMALVGDPLYKPFKYRANLAPQDNKPSITTGTPT